MSKSVPLRNPSESQKKPQKKTEKVEQKITLVAMLLLMLVKGYRYGISPLFPPCCRYVPTCSEYAVEAIARYGALRGDGLLSVVSCAAIPLLLAAMTRLNSFFTLSCMRCFQQVKQV